MITISGLTLDTEDVKQRLLSKIDTTEEDKCWEWRGTKNQKGYGSVSVRVSNGKSRSFTTHRLSYALWHNVDPGCLMVCHKCDNPSCINPSHLFLGTAKDNYWDSKNKGRASCIGTFKRNGALNPRARYTEDQVREMRKLFDSGWTIRQIVEKFGGVHGGVHAIVKRINWKHVK